MASKRVTVFGGSGFLSRQIVKSLAAEGVGIRVAVRHPERASFLQRMGRDGQIELARADVWEESTVARAVAKSTWVINAVGHYVEKSGATFDAIHGQGAHNEWPCGRHPPARHGNDGPRAAGWWSGQAECKPNETGDNGPTADRDDKRSQCWELHLVR